jgi:hypothetical protein
MAEHRNTAIWRIPNALDNRYSSPLALCVSAVWDPAPHSGNPARRPNTADDPLP